MSRPNRRRRVARIRYRRAGHGGSHSKRFLALWLFAAALVIAQFTALLHPLQHANLDANTHGGAACELCVAAGHLGAAAPAAPPAMPVLAPSAAALATNPPVVLIGAAPSAYLSRAPPAL